MAVIGIDLGTTYSAAAIYRNGEIEVIPMEGASMTLPSVVGVLPNGKIVVGGLAKRNQAKAPQDTVIEIKRKMGDPGKVRLGKQEFSPQEISSFILKEIIAKAEEYLGEEVVGVVISCPEYFKDNARAATLQAGELAGKKVLHILNEPTAAAYAYGLKMSEEQRNQENIFLVYDLGGGTFDVTVIRMIGNELKVIGTGGDPHLGGGNFDDRIVEWMLEHLARTQPEYMRMMKDPANGLKLAALKMRLKAYAEQTKKDLCGPPAREQIQFQIAQVDSFEGKPITFTETLTMDEFNRLINDYLDKSLAEIDVALKVPKEKYNYSEDNLTAVLMVGGSTRVPAVWETVKRRLPNTPLWGVEKGINPDEIVAMGAGIVAYDRDPESDIVSDIILIDVTGHTLSVAAMDPGLGKEFLSPIIPKETIIPTSAVHDFSSMGEFQRECHIRVYQGEGKVVGVDGRMEIDNKNTTMIGEFIIRIDPIKEPIPLYIGLNLNDKGILVAHATNGVTGQRVECNLDFKQFAQLPQEELNRRKEQLEAAQRQGVGSTANPLDGMAGSAAAGTAAGAARPAPQPFTSQPASASSYSQSSAGSADPTSQMNPIIRALYQKAITNFAKIPPDHQMQAMQLVTDMESTARSGDQNRLMQLYMQLNEVMKGID